LALMALLAKLLRLKEFEDYIKRLAVR
jgi:hypothetical protein